MRLYALRGLLRCIHCGSVLEAGSRNNGHGGTFERYSFNCSKRGKDCPSTGTKRTHAIPAKRLLFEAQDIADALAALHGMDIDSLLRTPSDAAKRKVERARLQERRRRDQRLYDLQDIDDAEYDRRREVVRMALAKLDAQEAPALTSARRILANVQDFPWLQATPEAQASVLQTLVEAFLVSPNTDRIVAVTPKPELRAYMRDRVFIKRQAAGWTVNPDGSTDRNLPDDWTIQFVEASEDSDALGVGKARSEGLEHVLATPIVRSFGPYLINRQAASPAGTDESLLVMPVRKPAMEPQIRWTTP